MVSQQSESSGYVWDPSVAPVTLHGVTFDTVDRPAEVSWPMSAPKSEAADVANPTT